MTDYFSGYTNFNGDTLSDLAEGWDEFKRPPSDALTGRAFSLFVDDGTQLDYVFVDEKTLRVAQVDQSPREETYEAHEEAPGAFIVGHHVSDAELPSYRYLILDLEAGRALIFLAAVTDQTGTRGQTSIAIAHAGIDTTSFEPMPEADDLIGQRTVWAYSHKHLFEHIYLNRNTFIWSCIRGDTGAFSTSPPTTMTLSSRRASGRSGTSAGTDPGDRALRQVLCAATKQMWGGRIIGSPSH